MNDNGAGASENPRGRGASIEIHQSTELQSPSPSGNQSSPLMNKDLALAANSSQNQEDLNPLLVETIQSNSEEKRNQEGEDQRREEEDDETRRLRMKMKERESEEDSTSSVENSSSPSFSSSPSSPSTSSPTAINVNKETPAAQVEIPHVPSSTSYSLDLPELRKRGVPLKEQFNFGHRALRSGSSNSPFSTTHFSSPASSSSPASATRPSPPSSSSPSSTSSSSSSPSSTSSSSNPFAPLSQSSNSTHTPASTSSSPGATEPPKQGNGSSGSNTAGPSAAKSGPQEGSSYECNICFEQASNPVISLCGHLYCWPCIHQWIESQAVPLCPVCKAGIGNDKVIPVYSRGGDTTDPRKTADIPNRPAGQRPQPERQQNFFARQPGAFHMNSPNGHFQFSAGFGLFPSMFGLQFAFPGPLDQINRPMTPEEERQALISRIFLMIGVFVMFSLMLV